MSSLRNAVKRITHKERPQPIQRQRLGILERKKDYKKRAVDYHQKQDKIKVMKMKAANRNPDEFYFGMNNSQIDHDGKHRSTTKKQIENNANQRDLPPDVIALMKNQDLSYIRMKKQSDKKKVDRLQSSLHLLVDDSTTTTTTTTGDLSTTRSSSKAIKKSNNKRKHTIFVNSKQEAESFHVANHFETLPEFAGRNFNRIRVKDLQGIATHKKATSSSSSRGSKTWNGKDNDHDNDNDNDNDNDDDDYYDFEEEPLRLHDLRKKAVKERKIAKKLAKERNASYKEMEARIERVKEMQNAEDHLLMEKKVAGKGRKRKIKEAEGGRPAQYKWRRKRLR